MRDLYKLPANLPIPKDDGACDHLPGMTLPDFALLSTSGGPVNIQGIAQTPTVIFFYPRTGEPDKPAPEGWDQIPGARGCTPQSCAFRDLYDEFKELGVDVFGASAQTKDYQREFAERNHITFEFLSDADFALTDALKLPTFTYKHMRLIKRLALYCDKGKIEKVFYPVFPPNKNAETVLEWLHQLKPFHQR